MFLPLVVSGLTFRSLIYSEFILVQGKDVDLVSFAYRHLVFPASFINKVIVWSMYDLDTCQYHMAVAVFYLLYSIVYVCCGSFVLVLLLCTYTLQYKLRSGIVKSSAFLFG